MKKIILTAIAVLGFAFSNAQTGGFAKGDAFISGALSVNSTKEGDAKTSGFVIEPKVGYFVSENIAIGAKLGFGSTKIGDVKTNDFTVGAFGRYYFTPASQFSVYGQAGVDFTNNKVKPGDFKSNEVGANLGLGLSYFLSNHFAIEATWLGLGYNVNNNGGHGAEKTNSFNFGTDLRDVAFGVVYKF
ncbi:outer membrane beta-barrel protein [Flavobacterium sp. KACC 22758]|jgi:outer membrane protein|uniref:outer membrane beta-barrel protein n=1 Tax=Flavobacterium sp. KACC 22758 TaxID=3025667 RepID=UPI002365FC69|nr:outer membrane beta-barrel protein [Flavobacterium sp. KACC 22758]WDF58922.1 outer membrane beta-barrel protein [Flavobacterium sp. KACC 22758]